MAEIISMVEEACCRKYRDVCALNLVVFRGSGLKFYSGENIEKEK
jgi:hypothetical protein